MIDHSRPFSVEFMTEAVKGTPAVAMAAEGAPRWLCGCAFLAVRLNNSRARAQ